MRTRLTDIATVLAFTGVFALAGCGEGYDDNAGDEAGTAEPASQPAEPAAKEPEEEAKTPDPGGD